MIGEGKEIGYLVVNDYNRKEMQKNIELIFLFTFAPHVFILIYIMSKRWLYLNQVLANIEKYSIHPMYLHLT